jgi:UDP-N-acetylglucosamine 1-carboxyvinyltransferase
MWHSCFSRYEAIHGYCFAFRTQGALMDVLEIHGKQTMFGELDISGSKNASLPILAASVMVEGGIVLHRVPHLKDVSNMLALLASLGVKATLNADLDLHLDTTHIHNTCIPEDLAKNMRASVLLLGPLLTRYSEATLPMPGGCAIGSRPIDLHLKNLEKLGVTMKVDDTCVHASIKGSRLQGADIVFESVTVTGTENLIMAAVLAEGKTTISGAAKEPEVVDLCKFLNHLGAKIQGMGSDVISIEGVERLGEGAFTLSADRIEAGTFLIAAAATRGEITLNCVDPSVLGVLIVKLRELGVEIDHTSDSIYLNARNKTLQAVDIETQPYPGFSTDFQPQWLAMAISIEGKTSVTERLFENRFRHVDALRLLGASIDLKGQQAIIHGGRPLKGCHMAATDLRASAALIIAALNAEGTSVIEGVSEHLDRGYENIEEKLQKLSVASLRREISVDGVV